MKPVTCCEQSQKRLETKSYSFEILTDEAPMPVVARPLRDLPIASMESAGIPGCYPAHPIVSRELKELPIKLAPLMDLSVPDKKTPST